MPVFDICSTDCVVARVASPALHLVSGTEAKQYIISQPSDGGRERAGAEDRGSGGKWLSVSGPGGEAEGETDVPQKKQTAATDSMEGISPLRDDGRAGAMLTRSRP